MSRHQLVRALALVVAIAGAAGAVVPAPTVLQRSGAVSPLGWPYSSFTEGVVDAAGRLVFVGSSTAIFGRTGATLTQRIGAGIVLPDGRRVDGVSQPALAADGCVIARATFSTGGEAIVRACGSTFVVLLDVGGEAPGGGTIRAFDPAVFVAGSDIVAVSAALENGISVVLRRDGGGVVELVRSGGPAPTGGTYAAFRLLGVTTGSVVGFRGTVSDGPDGIFAAGANGVHAVAVLGQGSPAGGSFTSVGGGHVHPAGTTTFRAGLSDGTSALFATDLAMPFPFLRTVAREGDALPIAGATIRGFPGSIDPAINAAGTVAFRVLIAGASDPLRPAGIFTVTPGGQVASIVSVRDEIPDIGTISRLRDPCIADDGSVVVSAVVSTVGPALYVARDGVLSPLARLGDPTSVDTGDARFRFGSASVTGVGEGAVFLGQRDAIFDVAADGAVSALAYTGRASPLGGTMALLGSPMVDGRGDVYFGADFQGAQFNEALLSATPTDVRTLVSPDRRLLGGGGIRELFPTSVDSLARPSAGAAAGVVFTAALQGAKASEAIFRARSNGRVTPIARVGQHAGAERLASLGTPSAGPGRAVGFLAEVGRDRRRTAVVAGAGRAFGVVALAKTSTRTRIGGQFGELGPPAMGRWGALFRATLADGVTEAIFVGHAGRVGVVAATGDTTVTGGRLRGIEDPIGVQDEVWFLARVAGSVAPPGLYRVRLARVPRRGDDPLPIEPMLLPGDPAPSPLGGVIVRVDAPRAGPSGIVAVVAGIGGGSASSAILQFVPVLP